MSQDRQTQHIRSLQAILTNSVQEAHKSLTHLASDASTLEAVTSLADSLINCFKARGKVLICGNGGSMCDASHFAEELTGRFRANRPPLAALALNDPGHITCTANDFGFDHIFERAVAALGNPADRLIVLSTSGNSKNCLLAAREGQRIGMEVTGLLGKGGGELKALCHRSILVPGETSDRIQELHMMILHIVVEMIEAAEPWSHR